MTVYRLIFLVIVIDPNLLEGFCLFGWLVGWLVFNNKMKTTLSRECLTFLISKSEDLQFLNDFKKLKPQKFALWFLYVAWDW